MNDPTYKEAEDALAYYIPKLQSGTPHDRRVNAMREALKAFLVKRTKSGGEKP